MKFFPNLLYTLYRYLNPSNLYVIQIRVPLFSLLLRPLQQTHPSVNGGFISYHGSSSKFVFFLERNF